MPARKKNKTEELNFETSMAELEGLVEAMESGDLTLEQSMEHFERGIQLTRNCQKTLSEAEQKVQILTKDSNGTHLSEFDSGEED